MILKIALSGKSLAEHVLTVSCQEANGITDTISGF